MEWSCSQLESTVSDNENRSDEAEKQPDGDVPSGEACDAPRVRRSDGPRKNTSERVIFHFSDRTVGGWALNMSRGGLRAIVEEQVSEGEKFELSVGESEERRAACIVWVRAAKDGSVVGISFVGSPFRSVPPPGPCEEMSES